jgi:hypothetical protein
VSALSSYYLHFFFRFESSEEVSRKEIWFTAASIISDHLLVTAVEQRGAVGEQPAFFSLFD